jgi:OOP family OmpA-OmpF porin
MFVNSKAAIAAGLASTLVFTATAHAADNQGWYGGLNLGRSHLGLSGSDLDNGFASRGITSSSALERRDTAYSLTGGYQFNRNLAVEGSFVNLGRFDYQTSTTAPVAGSISGRYGVHGFGVSAVGILPLQQGFSVYGKAGLLLARTELEANGSAGLATSETHSHSTNGTFGLGLSYDFTKNIVGKAEWNRYARVGDSNTGRGDIDLYSLGVAYKF